jgi:hypothetical protein
VPKGKTKRKNVKKAKDQRKKRAKKHRLNGGTTSWEDRGSKKGQKKSKKKSKKERKRVDPMYRGEKKAWSARIVSPSGQKTTG